MVKVVRDAGGPIEMVEAIDAAVNPARALFVQPQAWPAGADPAKYFNTIAAAMAQAALLIPTSTDPVVVYLYPGTYAGAYAHTPWTMLVGVGRLSAVVTGPWTYTPVDPLLQEIASAENVRFEAGGNGTINTLGKALAIQAQFAFLNCIINGDVTWLGRNASDDILLYFYCGSFTSILDVTSAQFFHVGCSLGITRLRGASLGIGASTLFIGEFHTFDTTFVIIGGNCTFIGPVTSEAGTGISAPSCVFYSALISMAGGVIDARGSEITGGAGALVGPGPIDCNRQFVSPTAIGANPVILTPPLSLSTYNVLLTDAVPVVVPQGFSVTAKTPVGFTINELNPGRLYDVTVVLE